MNNMSLSLFKKTSARRPTTYSLGTKLPGDRKNMIKSPSKAMPKSAFCLITVLLRFYFLRADRNTIWEQRLARHICKICLYPFSFISGLIHQLLACGSIARINHNFDWFKFFKSTKLKFFDINITRISSFINK